MAGLMETKGMLDLTKKSGRGGLMGLAENLAKQRIDSGNAPISREQIDDMTSEGTPKGFGGLSNLKSLIGGMNK